MNYLITMGRWKYQKIPENSRFLPHRKRLCIISGAVFVILRVQPSCDFYIPLGGLIDLIGSNKDLISSEFIFTLRL